MSSLTENAAQTGYIRRYSLITQQLIRGWNNRATPHDHDPRIAFDILDRLSNDPVAPICLLSLACHLVRDLWTTLKWPLSSAIAGPARNAAGSAALACESILQQSDSWLNPPEGIPIVLGFVAASSILFGQPDILPCEHITIYSAKQATSSNNVRAVRVDLGRGSQATAGLRDDLSNPSCFVEGTLLNTPVHMPAPHLAAILAAPSAHRGQATDALIFAAAVHRCAKDGTWPRVLDLAAEAGCTWDIWRACTMYRLDRIQGIGIPISRIVRALLQERPWIRPLVSEGRQIEWINNVK